MIDKIEISYVKRSKCCFKNIQYMVPKLIESWKLVSNIEIGGYIKKSDNFFFLQK